MKAVILAAGKGGRLYSYKKYILKCLPDMRPYLSTGSTCLLVMNGDDVFEIDVGYPSDLFEARFNSARLSKNPLEKRSSMLYEQT